MRFLFHVLCFLIPPPLPVPCFALALPRRLVAVANAFLGVVNIDLLLLTLFPWSPHVVCCSTWLLGHFALAYPFLHSLCCHTWRNTQTVVAREETACQCQRTIAIQECYQATQIQIFLHKTCSTMHCPATKLAWPHRLTPTTYTISCSMPIPAIPTKSFTSASVVLASALVPLRFVVHLAILKTSCVAHR
jgi:hypothetical protein